MIDIENKVYDDLYTLLIAADATANIDSKRVEAPSGFPHITIVQEDSTTASSSIARREDAAAVMFQIDIYTIDDKAKAKSLAAIVDGYMDSKGFKRTYFRPTPNVDRRIFRYTMRYTAKVIVAETAQSGITYHTY